MKTIIADIGIVILFISAIIGGITDNSVFTLIPVSIGLSFLAASSI